MELMREQERSMINCDQANWSHEGREQNTGFEFWLDVHH